MHPVKIEALRQYDPLFVFALSDEAADEFPGYRKCFTGIGKVNAAYGLTKAIQEYRPGLVVNLGSAGSARFTRQQVVCCTRFVQRDMNVSALGFAPYETPLSDLPLVLETGLPLDGLAAGTCGTGDSFECNHQGDAYDVVDMEAYALAQVAFREELPFLCLKYISDGADDKAAQDWNEEVHRAAVALRKVLEG